MKRKNWLGISLAVVVGMMAVFTACQENQVEPTQTASEDLKPVRAKAEFSNKFIPSSGVEFFDITTAYQTEDLDNTINITEYIDVYVPSDWDEESQSYQSEVHHQGTIYYTIDTLTGKFYQLALTDDLVEDIETTYNITDLPENYFDTLNTFAPVSLNEDDESFYHGGDTTTVSGTHYRACKKNKSGNWTWTSRTYGCVINTGTDIAGNCVIRILNGSRGGGGTTTCPCPPVSCPHDSPRI